jgi:glycosyltransferase involved in cell wall biosynthesis
MKILQIHNKYFIRGGEETVLNNEKKLLLKNGHKVKQLIRKNKNEITSIFNWFSVLKNLSYSKKSLEILENYFKKNELPDVVHIHNIFPLWSYSVFKFFNEKKIPIVLTVHNYRLILDKLDFFDNNFYKYGLFKYSKILTYIISRLFNKNKRLLKFISCFIFCTDFHRNIHKKHGFDKKKLVIKQNSLQLKKKYIKWTKREEKIIYVGRLSQEKGLYTLMKAWRIWGKDAPNLEIIGNGEDEIMLKKYKKKHLLQNIIFSGKLSYKKVQKKIEKSKLLIIPSEWYEPFGLVIIEALSKGTPVASSDIGSLPDLIKNYRHGFLFKTKNEHSLFKKVKKAWENKSYLKKLSYYAKKTDKFYTHHNNYQKLMIIYNKVIRNNKVQN